MGLSRIVMHLLLVGVLSLAAASVACSRGGLPRPKRIAAEAVPTEESAVVATHPPPAALPEIVPQPPSQRAQWLAGTWIWRRNAWVWQRGGWIENPERLRLVDSQVRFTKSGTLEFWPRRWINAENQEVDAPLVLAPSETPPTPELREDRTVP